MVQTPIKYEFKNSKHSFPQAQLVGGSFVMRASWTWICEINPIYAIYTAPPTKPVEKSPSDIGH